MCPNSPVCGNVRLRLPCTRMTLFSGRTEQYAPAQCPFQIGTAHISTTQPSGQNKPHHAIRVPYEPRRTCSREFARICPCVQMWGLGSLAREGRYFQVELNSACPHNDHFKLVLPISRPLNPLARTSCSMLFVYHTNHIARVAENLPEFARVRKSGL